jgi:hypothetical protein
MTLDAALPQECMANHVCFTGSPGDVLIFDTAIWHTAMANTSGRDRRAIIMGWNSTAAGGGSRPLFSDEQWSRLVAAGRTTPTLQQLSGR